MERVSWILIKMNKKENKVNYLLIKFRIFRKKWN